MMGSVLSLLDPLEPVTALGGERRLHMTTNLFAATAAAAASKQQQQQQQQQEYRHLHRPANQNAGSWRSSPVSAKGSPAHPSSSQVTQKGQCDAAAATLRSSRRAVHAQDESALAAAAAAVTSGCSAAPVQQQRTPAVQAQERSRLQLQQRRQSSSARVQRTGTSAVAGEQTANLERDDRISHRPDHQHHQPQQQQQQRHKSAGSGRLTHQNLAAVARAAVAAADAEATTQSKTITTQVACTTIGLPRGQLDHRQLNQPADAADSSDTTVKTTTLVTQNNLTSSSSSSSKLLPTSNQKPLESLSSHQGLHSSTIKNNNNIQPPRIQLTEAAGDTANMTLSVSASQQIADEEAAEAPNRPKQQQQQKTSGQKVSKPKASKRQPIGQSKSNPLSASVNHTNSSSFNQRPPQQHHHQQQQQQQQQQSKSRRQQARGRKRAAKNHQQMDGPTHKTCAATPSVSGGVAGHQKQPTRSSYCQVNHQPQRQQRDHRSQSTSSSLGGSSGSSSPSSSSMLHIFSRRELQRQRMRRQQQQQQQQHQHQYRPQQHSSSRPPSSSACSTVSSLSGSEVPVVFAHQQPPVVYNRERGPALLAMASQQPRLEVPSEPGYPISEAALYPRPPPRPWLHQQQQQSSARKRAMQGRPDGGPEFTVISYNVLCDRMVNRQIFPSSPDIALNWFYRRELILRQLLEFDADIIALQELEIEQFETYFKPELSQLGQYEAIFEPKSRARYTSSIMKRNKVDGCAIFYKRHKFRLVQKHLLEFSQMAMANAQGSEAMLNRVMTKDNIGLAAVLEFIGAEEECSGDDDEATDQHEQSATLLSAASPMLANDSPTATKPLSANIRQRASSQMGSGTAVAAGSSQRILVCNTHIYWDPECCDVKLIQTIMLMNELECIARHYATCRPTTSEPTNHLDLDLTRLNTKKEWAKLVDETPASEAPLLPLVLLGDFNSMPNSGVASYLTAGKINSLHRDFKSIRYTSCSNALAHQHFQPQHPAQQWTSGDSYGSNSRSSDTNNNFSNTTHLSLGFVGSKSEIRRQSSPAWCFYPPNSSLASTAPLPGTSPPATCCSTSPAASITSAYSSSPPSSASSLHQQQHHHYNHQHDKHLVSKQILNYNHPFKLVSAYEKETMPYTNYTDNFKAIIDYIFYTNDSIKLVGLLGPLDKNWLKGNRIKGLPQPHLPSDHLPLLVKLQLCSRLIKHEQIRS